MGLTQKILLFTSALVVALVGITLAFTTAQADRLARATIDEGLHDTRDILQACHKAALELYERKGIIPSADRTRELITRWERIG